MNFLKRAFHSITFNKKNTGFTLIMFFLLSTLILSSFCIILETNKYLEETRFSTYTSVTVINDHITTEDYFYGRSDLPLEPIIEISKSQQVKELKLTAYSLVYENETIKSHQADIQKENYGDNKIIRVEGVNSIEDVYDFTNEKVSLYEGVDIKGTSNGAIISLDLANLSGLKLGDSISLDPYYTEINGGKGTVQEMKIVGIYVIGESGSYSEQAYFNKENLIYVLPETVLALNGMKGVYSAEFVLNDPLKMDSFIEEIKAGNYDTLEWWSFLANDTQYRTLRNMTDTVSQIMYLMLTAVIFLGGIVLIFLTMIALKSRDFEMGILMSIGENKWKIIMQYFLESLVPVTAAMLLGILAGPYASKAILDFIGGFTAGNIFISSSSIVLMFSCGVLLTVVASSLTIYKVLRYNPKNVLVDIE